VSNSRYGYCADQRIIDESRPFFCLVVSRPFVPPRALLWKSLNGDSLGFQFHMSRRHSERGVDVVVRHRKFKKSRPTDLLTINSSLT